MNELIEGKVVVITNLQSKKEEQGIVKRFMGKLVIGVKRNSAMVNINQDALSLYDVKYAEDNNEEMWGTYHEN